MYADLVDIVLLIFFFVFGSIVGSYLNVVSLRFGFSEPPRPRSACMHCNATLRAHELVPLASYLMLRGRCSHCKSAISTQYPLVEGATALLFVLVAALIPFNSIVGAVTFVAHLLFVSISVLITVYDIRHTLIPHRFLVLLFAAAMVATAVTAVETHSWQPFFFAFFAGLIPLSFFGLISIVTHGRGMGAGDAFVAGAIGILLGVSYGILASVFGVWLGAAVGIAALVYGVISPVFQLRLGGVRGTLRAELPFAPFLFLGALIAFVMMNVGGDLYLVWLAPFHW